MKKMYFLHWQVSIWLYPCSFIIFIMCWVNITPSIAQLRFNELSGDSGNNDGTNDGIVELINTGASDFDASCYVISNGEWVVVLPPNTIIPAGKEFLIACSEGKNSGANPNPVPGSGLTCATCDFPALPIDFDVCDPANSAYVDWAATGFTIDNQGDIDGDQVVLFEPDGTIVQAAKWGGGATGVNDNTSLQTGAYTLGTAGSGGNGISSALLPNALKAGESCYNMGVKYSMPIITDAIYADLTNILNPDDKTINNTVLQGCNSSFIYNVATMTWSKTDHPNPGQPNNAIAYNFTLSASAVQCAGATQPVTATLEVYNWQAVTPGITNAKGGIGSFVSFDGGATPIAWDSYNRDNTTGVTKFTYTFTPSGNQTLSLVWDDDKSSLFASTPTGSSSATSVVKNTTPSDCYVVYQIPTVIIQTLSVSDVTISCPTDFPNGTVNIGALTNGGFNNTFELIDNNISQGINNTGIFAIPDDLNGPITILVTDGSACTAPITVHIDNNCRQAPLCPTNLTYDACITPDGNKCPNDIITLGLTATDLPLGGKVEWVQVASASDDPYTTGTVVATQDITAGGTASVYISSYLANPAGTDCATGSDETIILTNPGASAVDMSGFIIIGNSGGTPMYTVPNGTTIAPGGTYTFNSCPNPGNSGQTFLANSNFPRTIQLQVNGITVQTVSYNAAASGITYTVSDPGLNYQLPASAATLSPACVTYTVPTNACNSTLYIRPRIIPVDVACNNPTLAAHTYDIVCPTAVLSGSGTFCAPTNGTVIIDIINGGNGNMISGNITDGTNDFPFSGVTVADGTAMININNINITGDYVIKNIAITNTCQVDFSGTATIQINPVPDVTLAGAVEVCEGLIAEIPFTTSTGSLPLMINYNIDGGASQTVEVFNNQLNISSFGLSIGNHTINIESVIDENGCIGTATGSAMLDVHIQPNITPTITQPSCANAGSISFAGLTGANFTYAYSTDGGTNFTTMMPINGNVTLPLLAGAQDAATYLIRVTNTDAHPDCVADFIITKSAVSNCICNNPATANAGDDQTSCGAGAINLSATTNGTGTWSGGAGTFLDATSPTTTYTPDASEIGKTVTLTWTTTDPDGTDICTAASDDVIILIKNLPTITLEDNPTVCQGTTQVAWSYNASTQNPDQYSIDFDSPLFTDITNQPLPAAPGNMIINIPADLPGDTYRATLTVRNSNSLCQSQAYFIEITINAVNAGTIGSNQTICTTKDPDPFSATPAIATPGASITYQWERSFTDCNSDFFTIADTELYDVAKGALTQTAYFRRRAIAVLNGTRCEALSNCLIIKVLKVDCGGFPWNGN